ncbi:MAG: toxin-antitoxin system HicB family antitoxin [Candidatus Nealsonbacteria bacterium]|nr:toxin-antitoxin system HicB family antitoxin [Candidatus Nealsonbacteria bacterium]
MIEVEMQEDVQRIAENLFSLQPDWITFYREIFGLHGIVRQKFRSREELAEFEQSEAYQDLQQMLTKLRGQGPLAADPEEPTRVITVRLPKSLHEALRVEAYEHHTSMNKLCVSKLLQFIDDQMVPAEM